MATKSDRAPRVGFWFFSIGKDKALDAIVLESINQGATSEQIIKAIFADKPVSKIRPRVAEKGRFIFSKSQINKYQVNVPSSMAILVTWVD